MHRFKVGQKVVAVKSHSGGEFKIGDIFIVDELNCCCKCGLSTICLNGKDEYCIVVCSCNYTGAGREHYTEMCFEPIQNISDAVEYKMKVSIPELTEIKEYQNQ